MGRRVWPGLDPRVHPGTRRLPVDALPGPGRWTLWVKRAGGVLLLLMAEYYFVRMGSVL